MARLHPAAAEVSFDGMTVTGVAMFDAPDGVVEGICGPLGSGAEIGIGSTSPLAVYAEAFRAMRRDSPHRALVLTTLSGAPGLAMLNAEAFNAPYGPPILLVDSGHEAALSAAAAANRPMTVRLQSERVQAQARNVVVRLAGTDPERPPLVVMTPRSSWWTSTSERGGGLVCWLACLRALLAIPPGCDTVFTANSGHELGHAGLDAFMATRPGWISRATWLHWDANIGAAGGITSVVSGHDGLRHSMATALAAQGQAHTLAPDGVMPHGESRDSSSWRSLHHAGRHQSPIPSSARSPSARDRSPCGRSLCRRSSRAGGASLTGAAVNRTGRVLIGQNRRSYHNLNM